MSCGLPLWVDHKWHERPWIHEYNRQTIKYEHELWPTPMGRPQIAQSRPKFYGAKGVLLAPWAMWRKKIVFTSYGATETALAAYI